MPNESNSLFLQAIAQINEGAVLLAGSLPSKMSAGDQKHVDYLRLAYDVWKTVYRPDDVSAIYDLLPPPPAFESAPQAPEPKPDVDSRTPSTTIDDAAYAAVEDFILGRDLSEESEVVCVPEPYAKQSEPVIDRVTQERVEAFAEDSEVEGRVMSAYNRADFHRTDWIPESLWTPWRKIRQIDGWTFMRTHLTRKWLRTLGKYPVIEASPRVEIAIESANWMVSNTVKEGYLGLSREQFIDLFDNSVAVYTRSMNTATIDPTGAENFLAQLAIDLLLPNVLKQPEMLADSAFGRAIQKFARPRPRPWK